MGIRLLAFERKKVPETTRNGTPSWLLGETLGLQLSTLGTRDRLVRRSPFLWAQEEISLGVLSCQSISAKIRLAFVFLADHESDWLFLL